MPGHERFVRNMLAGAHGIDAVLLVVAADESVMPQTREHFHICRLLAIPRGAIVLTKCDVADADSIALAEIEARELVAGSFLEGAPILRVSSRTGQGLDALRAELRRMAGETPPRAAGGLVRLPIDRAFVLKGFGTVVTGTLVAGTIAAGDELEILPSGRRVRVRGLQVHGAAAPRVEAGHRAAVNLAGIEVAEVTRGDVLTRPGTLRATSIVEAELSLLPGERPLKDQARVRVHLASAEVLARVRILSAPPVVAPGTTRLVQLRLERPAVAGRGDRVVIRSYSPAATIGGRGRGRSAGPPQAPRGGHGGGRRRPRRHGGRGRRGRHRRAHPRGAADRAGGRPGARRRGRAPTWSSLAAIRHASSAARPSTASPPTCRPSSPRSTPRTR